ncbi:MAG: hypothetical protein HY898_27795 [Deltaproteobacteria bacterium]|nr:hypothetical protein [Deltaproteobacteria bacterium]
MNSDTLRIRIQSITQKYTAEIVAVFVGALANAASELGISRPAATQSTAGRKPKAPAAAKRAKAKMSAAKSVGRKAAAPKSGRAKRERRSGDALVADGERVVKLLAANKKGLRIEQINNQLGTTTKQLARPIQKLLASGRVKKTGEKRGTVYSAG